MVLDEKEWRNLMIDIMCDAMGCTNWDFEPNENGDKFIKKWTEVFKQRFSQQPPKERKVSLEEIKIIKSVLDYYNLTEDGFYTDVISEEIAKRLNAVLDWKEGG
jgi:hypothetical protein